MAGLLAKIGRGTFRHRWATLLAWLMILIAVASISVIVSKPESTQFTVPGTQSQQAMDLLEQRFPPPRAPPRKWSSPPRRGRP